MSTIPEIADTVLEALAMQMKPAVRFVKGEGGRLITHDEGELYWIKPVDLRRTAFTWDPKPTRRATGLVKLRDITTCHTYGYHGFFKPSIAEVIAQIPLEILPDVVAFETRTDLGLGNIVGDHHVTTTTLYGSRRKKKKTPKKASTHHGPELSGLFYK